MYHTNIITLKYVIILKKIKEKEKLSEDIADIITSVKMALASNFIDLIERYKWAISNIDVNTVKEIGLIRVKKYWQHSSQIKIELD